jgi:hypothetical protein
MVGGRVMKNNNCDGSACTRPNGEVRVFPLGAGGNLILCADCFRRENDYRRRQGLRYGRPQDFPQHNWYACEVYDNR